MLIAARSLRDPNFFKSVVLIVEHNGEGAMGVVVNRPSGVTVAHALKKHFELPETGEMVHIGGPVERNALFILHNADDLEASETPIIDGLFVGSSPDTFENVIQRAAASDPELKYRVYFGCAGWGPDQLEGEVGRNDWLILPARLGLVFHPEPYNVWDEAVTEHRHVKPVVPGAPANPEWN
jgi:putative transcriptional regulator